ncbi:type II secretion system F family protein [Edaphobacter bradus]|uniref:type II secretion system F family protein n=1 Tax=Edaphobacter bradus TaxID=2259016 RepID=UPI0021E09322|nr:type II secretion system F family protein [Edaphobacter bradus]
MTLAFILLALTLFLGITAITLLLQARSSAEVRLSRALAGDRVQTDETEQPQGVFSKFAQSVTALVGRTGVANAPEFERQLGLAGYRKPAHLQYFLTAKLLLPIVAAVSASFLVSQNVVFWVLVCGVVGYFLPDLWLSSAITRHREAVRLAMPDALDLLIICMEAGLGIDQALIRVGTELSLNHPQLSDEFRIINLEQRAGTPRIEAWRHMAERTKLEVVASFVSMLVQTDRFGTPISKSLGTFSESLRTERRQKAEELAAKTTIKMVFPLVLFIFPSMFIVLLAPAIISIKHSMGNAFQ